MKFLKKLLYVIIVMQWSNVFAMSGTKTKLGLSITKLKGTHEVLKNYPGYEPFWGLVFAEKDVAQNLYTFSTHQIKKEAAAIVKGADAEWEPFKKTVEEYFKDKQNTATQNLVRQMFHEVGGTFNVTNALNNPVTQFTPEILGKILRMVHDAKMYDDAFIKLVEDYLVTLTLKDPAGKDFKAKDFRPFVKSLAGAVRECSSTNPQALFAPNTAQGIVLGYLLWKSNERYDLEQYFKGFLGHDVTLPDEQYSPQEFQKIVQTTSDLQDDKQFADFVCAMIYQEKYAAVFPKMVKSVNVNFAGVSFTDCMDSTMLNVVNIATYDQQKARLGLAPKGLTMSNALTNFYNKHTNPADIANAQVNQDWTDVVQNMIGVAYNRLADPATKAFIEVRELCDGVIPVVSVDRDLPAKKVQIGQKEFEVYEKQVGDQDYWLVLQRSGLVCCEMMPTTSNIIVVMNHLFHLQLYENVNTVFNHDFAKKYFAKMCQKFGWSVGQDVSDDIVIQVLEGKQFTIHLRNKAHGYISINEAANVGVSDSVKNQVAKLSPEKQAVSVALGLKSELYNLSNIFYDQLLEMNKRLGITQKCLPVCDSKYVHILENLILSLSGHSDHHFLFILTENYKQLDVAKKKVFKKTFKVAIDLYGLKFKKIEFFGPAISAGIFDQSDRDCVISLIQAGLDTKEVSEAFSLAAVAVEKGLFDRSNVGQIILWIQALFDRNENFKAFYLATTAVTEGLLDRSNVVQIILWIQAGLDRNEITDPFYLAKKAVEQGLFDISNVAHIIQAGLDRKTINNALDLAKVAVKQGLFDVSNVAQIISLIQAGLKGFEIINAFDLARTAVGEGLLDRSNVVQIISWIQAGLDRNKISEALYLAEDAVEKGLFDRSNVAQIISWIQAGLDRNKIFSAFDLAKVAVKQGLFDVSNVGQIISWIQAGLEEHRIIAALDFASIAVEKGLFGISNVDQISSWIQQGLRSQEESDVSYALNLKEAVENKFGKKEHFELEQSRQPKGNMIAVVATGKGMLSQTQVDNMRAGLPKDLQPFQPAQEQFTPPSADQLERQRQAIEDFNQNQQEQQQARQVPVYQPQQLQLPVGQQAPAQQQGMLARWRANIKNALRGGMRSVPR